MNYTRIALASVGAFAAYFILGGLMFTALPLANEFAKYPNVYRSRESIIHAMPAGMAAMYISMLALAVMYAMMYRAGFGLRQGALFGALIGVYAIGSFVVHNYVNLNIGLKLTAQQGVAYFIEWVAVGIAIGLIYRPPVAQ
jgi:hypothetical protein